MRGTANGRTIWTPIRFMQRFRTPRNLPPSFVTKATINRTVRPAFSSPALLLISLLLFAVYFHLFLLEYFWQLSAFDHGRFRTVLLHLMTTGVRVALLFSFSSSFSLLLFLSVCHVTSVLFCRRIPFRTARRLFRRRVEFSHRGRSHTRFSLRLALLLCVSAVLPVLWLCAGGSGKPSLSFIASFTSSVITLREERQR